MVVNNHDAGVQFLEWEEELAHWELDQIAMRLWDPEKDDRKQNSLSWISRRTSATGVLTKVEVPVSSTGG